MPRGARQTSLTRQREREPGDGLPQLKAHRPQRGVRGQRRPRPIATDASNRDVIGGPVSRGPKVSENANRNFIIGANNCFRKLPLRHELRIFSVISLVTTLVRPWLGSNRLSTAGNWEP